MFRELNKLFAGHADYREALHECHEMLGLCRDMIHASVDSLRRSDSADVAIDIGCDNRLVEALERDVRRKILKSLSQGDTTELSAGLSVVTVVVAIERIGDYALHIHELAKSHPARLDGGSVETRLRAIEERSLEAFDAAIDCFRDGDVEEAKRLTSLGEDVIDREHRFERELVGADVDLPVPDAVVVALYAMWLRCIATQSRTLASSVIEDFDRIGVCE